MLAFLHRFPPFGSIRVTDSAGDIRDYSTETEDPSDLDEVIDINTKMNGSSTILRVHGEIDLSDEITGSGARVVGPDMSYVQLHVHRIP